MGWGVRSETRRIQLNQGPEEEPSNLKKRKLYILRLWGRVDTLRNQRERVWKEES